MSVGDLLGQLAQAQVFDLARPLEAATPTSPNHPPFRMALLRRHGDRVRTDGSSGANELMTLGAHTATHVDALSHVAIDGKLHGGVDAAAASVGGRFTQHGAEEIPLLLCRGVLLDIARLHGRDVLDPGQAVTADDLDRAAAAAGLTVERGDCVLIRTGWAAAHYDDTATFVGLDCGVPGPDESAAAWLIERGVRATGAETIAYERIPPGEGHALLPVHNALLVNQGIFIFEVMNLDEVAAAGVTEFVFCAAPIKIAGATGAPARPLAIVPARR